MNHTLSKHLMEVSAHFLAMIRRDGGVGTILFPNTPSIFLGFTRTRVAQRLVEPWQTTVPKLVVEIITIKSQIGPIRHDKATTIITFLGKTEGFEESGGSLFYYRNLEPVTARAGITLEILPGMSYAFCTTDNRNSQIAFLNVQSEPTDNGF